MKRFRVWLDSGANHDSCYEVTVTIDKEFGLSNQEWDALAPERQEELMREIAFASSDWGFAEIQEGEEA